MKKSMVIISAAAALLLMMMYFMTSGEYDYDSFEDVGLWRKIENGQYYRGYELEANTVYFVTECGSRHIVRGADPETFRICQGTNYAKDKNRIYYISEEKKTRGDSVIMNRMENADVRTFKYIGAGCAMDINGLYYKGLPTEYDGNVLEVLYLNFQ